MNEEMQLKRFSRMTTFEESFRYIQANPNIVSRAFSDHLMARAFSLQSDDRDREARLCVKWSFALNYSLQMGPDGVGLFYNRFARGQGMVVLSFG